MGYPAHMDENLIDRLALSRNISRGEAIRVLREQIDLHRRQKLSGAAGSRGLRIRTHNPKRLYVRATGEPAPRKPVKTAKGTFGVTCTMCETPVDELNPECSTCRARHASRKWAAQEAERKEKRENPSE